MHSSGTASLTVWVGHEQPERGCGLEACRAMITWGFEQLQLNTVLADVFGTNPIVLNLLGQLGFIEVERKPPVTTYLLTHEAWAERVSAQQ